MQRWLLGVSFFAGLVAAACGAESDDPDCNGGDLGCHCVNGLCAVGLYCDPANVCQAAAGGSSAGESDATSAGSDSAADDTTSTDGGTTDTGTETESESETGSCMPGFDGCPCAFGTTCYEAGQACVGGFCQDDAGTTSDSGGTTTTDSGSGTTGEDCFDVFNACQTDAIGDVSPCSSACSNFTTPCEIAGCDAGCWATHHQAMSSCYDAASCLSEPASNDCREEAYLDAVACYQACVDYGACAGDLGSALGACG